MSFLRHLLIVRQIKKSEPLPPEQVVTPWGTWVEAICQTKEVFNDYSI